MARLVITKTTNADGSPFCSTRSVGELRVYDRVACLSEVSNRPPVFGCVFRSRVSYTIDVSAVSTAYAESSYFVRTIYVAGRKRSERTRSKSRQKLRVRRPISLENVESLNPVGVDLDPVVLRVNSED